MQPIDALRLFIAIDLPPEVKRLLSELQARLRRHPAAVRWSDPAGTHLTLKFLGAVPRSGVDAVAREMQRAAALHPPLTLRTAELGMFPNAQRPRVVWLGVAGALHDLAQLKAEVERTVAPLGYPAEARAFSPHLTLGRSAKQPTTSDLVAIARAVAQTAVPRVVEFSADEVVLMRSEPTPAGARYTTLARARLDARG